MIVRLSGEITAADVVGTIVPAGFLTDRREGESATQRLHRTEQEEIILKKVTAPPIPVKKSIPLIVKAENVINPGRSTGMIYVDGKLVDETPILERLTNKKEKGMFEDILELLPLGGLAVFAFLL